MAKKTKKIQSELHVLRAVFQAQIDELRADVRKLLASVTGKAAQAPKKVVHAKKAVRHDALAEALKSHKQGKALVKAGQQKDQLLRALIPMYVARGGSVEVNSGAISAFWKRQGISFAGPNAAKALRSHIGYAALNKAGKGWVISPNGVKYVEAALGKVKLAA